MTYTTRHPQCFYTTTPQPCPYLPGRMEKKVMTELKGRTAAALNDRLSQAGFRRSHTIAYAPVCDDCTACIPLRIPVGQFTPDRTRRRVLKRNATLTARDVPATPTEEQFALFRQYQLSRHTTGDMASMDFDDYSAMIADSPVRTFLTEFRTENGQLTGVCLNDLLEDGLSAVYSFYDPARAALSPGTFAVLHLIGKTRELNLPYLYLGYWIAESPKMSYKSSFRPAEIFTHGTWHALETPASPFMPQQDSLPA